MKLTAPLRRDAIIEQSGTCHAIRLLSCLAGSCAVLVTPHLQEPGQLLGLALEGHCESTHVPWQEE